ncbi:MAG: HEPN domain-containing protein [Armatimonadota bacterium]
MQRDSGRADAPSRWLRNARADLAIAGIKLPPGGQYEQLCFHAQQAAEKSIKAVLLKLEIDFPFTHNSTASN